MHRYSKILTDLERNGNLRSIPVDRTVEPMIDFSSNDYLGLAAREDLRREFLSSPAAADALFSSSASRLLAASQQYYTELEDLLANLYARESLLFNSGYHANSGLIPALALPDSLILADRLVHASIIDGIMLAKCDFARFRHNDINHLENLISRSGRPNGEGIIVIVESIYSMDGDSAPIEELIALKARYTDIILYIDEAHAFGVAGPRGLGLVMASSRPEAFDVVIGTLGKAAASMGAFAAISSEIKSLAVNKARSFIFSTALPPVNVAWSSFIIRNMLSMDAERQHLKQLAETLASRLDSGMCSHIIPFIVGDAEKAVKLSRHLETKGLKVLPIRTPTVPAGTERLRISLSASMSVDDIHKLANELQVCK